VEQATVVSAGIHGNETAPIEILLQIMQALSEGQQPLSMRCC
jgi:succinylglutamate desuccinylase